MQLYPNRKSSRSSGSAFRGRYLTFLIQNSPPIMTLRFENYAALKSFILNKNNVKLRSKECCNFCPFLFQSTNKLDLACKLLHSRNTDNQVIRPKKRETNKSFQDYYLLAREKQEIIDHCHADVYGMKYYRHMLSVRIDTGRLCNERHARRDSNQTP